MLAVKYLNICDMNDTLVLYENYTDLTNHILVELANLSDQSI